MTSLLGLTDYWEYKLLFSIMMVVFAPFKTSLLILFLMIFLDSITGSIYAFKIKKFSSSKLRRGLGKFILYISSFLVTRLLELGIYQLYKTSIFTNVLVSYLLFTESLSVLENLTLLGVPLPISIKNIILSQIKNNILVDLFNGGIKKNEILSEIIDMIDYQLPSIKDEKLKTFLRIKLEEWSEFLVILDKQFLGYDKEENNDLIYLRVTAQLTSTFSRINERWIEEDIPQRLVDDFNGIHERRIEEMVDDIKLICYSESKMEEIRKKISERIIVALYQNIVNAHKMEKILWKVNDRN